MNKAILVIVLFPYVLIGQGECISGDCENGQGTFIFNSGDKYEGEFQSGFRHGMGTYLWEDGKQYKGIFKNGNIHGKGIFRWPNGDKFLGNYKDNKMHGTGTFLWADGRKYKGDYVDGKMHGEGIYTWPDGSRYNGQFADNMRNGKGVFKYTDGKLYRGEFYNNKKQGQGILIWPSGKAYSGEFTNDEMHGSGKLIYPDGRKLEANYAYGESSTPGESVSDNNTSKILQELINEYEQKSKSKGNQILVSKSIKLNRKNNWVQANIYLRKGLSYKLAVIGPPEASGLSFRFTSGNAQEWIEGENNIVLGEIKPFESGNYTIQIKADIRDNSVSKIRLNYILSRI